MLYIPGYVIINGGAAIKQYDDSNEGGWNEHLGVDSYPGEIQANLLSKVLPMGRNMKLSKLSFGIQHPLYVA